jgi:hypothetical protein
MFSKLVKNTLDYLSQKPMSQHQTSAERPMTGSEDILIISDILQCYALSYREQVEPLLSAQSGHQLIEIQSIMRVLRQENITLDIAQFKRIIEHPSNLASISVTHPAIMTLVAQNAAALDALISAASSQIKTVIEDFTKQELIARFMSHHPELGAHRLELTMIIASIDMMALETQPLLAHLLEISAGHHAYSFNALKFIILSQKKSRKAAELLRALPPELHLSELPTILQNKNNFDIFYDLIILIVRESPRFLTQERFDQLVRYSRLNSIALAINYFKRFDVIDIFWFYFDYLITLEPEALERRAATLSHQIGQQRASMLFFTNWAEHEVIVESSLSRRHDYSHQEHLNNGTYKTIKACSALYKPRIATLEQRKSLTQEIKDWLNTRDSCEKHAILRAFSSIKAFKRKQHAVYQINLNDFILMCWCGINDTTQHKDGVDLDAARDLLVMTLQDITPGLCFDGHFNKLCEALVLTHRAAVQSASTLKDLYDKFPFLVKKCAQQYLETLCLSERTSRVEQIAAQGLSVIWPHIAATVERVILDDFEHLVPDGLRSETLIKLVEYIDDLSFEFEDRAHQESALKMTHRY